MTRWRCRLRWRLWVHPMRQIHVALLDVVQAGYHPHRLVAAGTGRCAVTAGFPRAGGRQGDRLCVQEPRVPGAGDDT